MIQPYSIDFPDSAHTVRYLPRKAHHHVTISWPYDFGAKEQNRVMLASSRFRGANKHYTSPTQAAGGRGGSGGTVENVILESILSSQKQMQETMNQLLHRVDALEDTVKESSVSSSSHDEKKAVRLSSELCQCKFLLIFDHHPTYSLSTEHGCYHLSILGPREEEER